MPGTQFHRIDQDPDYGKETGSSSITAVVGSAIILVIAIFVYLICRGIWTLVSGGNFPF